MEPTKFVGFSVALMLVGLVALSGPLLTGCAADNGPRITADQCAQAIEIAKVAFEECNNVGRPDDPDRAEKIARCYRYAEAGAALATMACGFIPPESPSAASDQ